MKYVIEVNGVITEDMLPTIFNAIPNLSKIKACEELTDNEVAKLAKEIAINIFGSDNDYENDRQTFELGFTECYKNIMSKL